MLFSKSCEYGLRAMMYLAVENKKVSLIRISDHQGLPSHYLSKILQQLVRAKLVDSSKGPTGGFWLKKPLNQIRLSHIVDAIDGMDCFERCGLGLKKCDSQSPCPIHTEFESLREGILALFYTKTLSDIVEDYSKGICVIHV